MVGRGVSATPQAVDVVILDEDEAHIAAIAVRKYLADLRSTYRRDTGAKGES